jgi:hypothetical protein
MKRQKPQIGDVFLVPQQDGKCSLGQVLAFEKQMMNSVSCAFYDMRFTSSDDVQLPPTLPFESIIAVLFTTHDLLRRGTWKIVGHMPVSLERAHFPYEHLRGSGGWTGAKMHGSGIVREFLDAFYGLSFWDDWHDPAYLDGLLFRGRQRPANIKLKGKEEPINSVQPTRASARG